MMTKQTIKTRRHTLQISRTLMTAKHSMKHLAPQIKTSLIESKACYQQARQATVA
jgi:hypothetical protein